MATQGKLVRANRWFDNKDKDTRTFDVVAEIQYTGDAQIATIVNGVVHKGDKAIGNFSVDFDGRRHYDFAPVVTAKEEAAAIADIAAFVAEVAVSLTKNTL